MTFPRKYSVADIAQMRADVMSLHSLFPGDRIETEMMLQTYLMSGTDPCDLQAAAFEAAARRQDVQERDRRLEGLVHAGGIGGDA